MLLAGDELGRTQGGNNNAYCQDNPTSWLDWANADTALLAYTAALIALRRAHPALRRRRYLSGAQPGEISWFTPAGAPMNDADWADPATRTVALLVDGRAEPDRDERGRPMIDDHLLVLFNGWWEPMSFGLPPAPSQSAAGSAPTTWRLELDTAAGLVRPGDAATHADGAAVLVQPRSVLLLAASSLR
jgi:glycogen operon protein